MTTPDPQVPDPPATWENVLAGEAEEVLGRALGRHEMVEEGEERKEIAHEVREEYREERR